jgi:hypothetical protein
VTRVSRLFQWVAAIISPSGVIIAETPELVARAWGRRVSTLRKAAEIKCSLGARSSGNHESFERVTMRSAPMRAASATNSGNTAS